MSDTCHAAFSDDSACRCVEPTDHTDNHLCDCGGSWTPEGQPVLFPGGLTKDEAMDTVLTAVFAGDAAAAALILPNLFGGE